MSATRDQVCGLVGDSVLYRISIPMDAYNRLVTLSLEGVAGLPDWLDWGNDTNLGARIIATTDPSYFEHKENPDAQTPGRHPQGFTEL